MKARLKQKEKGICMKGEKVEKSSNNEGGRNGRKAKLNDYTYSSNACVCLFYPSAGRIELIQRRIKYTHSHNYRDPRKFSSREFPLSLVCLCVHFLPDEKYFSPFPAATNELSPAR